MGPNSAISEKFFAALAAGDAATLRAVCNPNLQLTQNGGAAMDIDGLIGMSSAVRGVVAGFRYDNAQRVDTPDGFVEEHDVRGTLPDGTECSISACVVGQVEDGKVVVLREYFDTAAAAGLFKALGA